MSYTYYKRKLKYFWNKHFKRSHTFEITAGRLGGEHTIGTIPNSVANYWLKKNNEDFQEYLFSWDKEQIEKDWRIPKKYQLNEWFEYDDIMHQCTIEFDGNNWFQIYDKDIGKSFYIDFKEIDKKEIKVDTSEMDKVKKSKKSILFGQSWEKGNATCTCYDSHGDEVDFVLNKPFDKSKIKNVRVSNYDGLLLLNGFDYEDYSFEVMLEDSIGKGYNAWIQ